jgi:hypothetical protein
LETSTAGTNEPGQYHINIVASGANYTNSGYSQAETIQATGPGGSGWQLAFSDEFACPNNMLECGQGGTGSVVSASSYTWSSSFCSGLSSPSAEGCGVLTVASLPSGISAANCTGTKLGACDISVAGATNGGSAGNSAVNGTFLVVGVPDSTHIDLYMPYSGIAATMGGTITVGSGPWVTALVTSNGSSGLPLLGSNDNTGESEGWDPHNCSVVGKNLFQINITTTGTRYLNTSGATTANYIPPSSMQVSGNGYTATMCHIQTWNGASGFTASQEFYFDDDAEEPSGTPHAAIWTLSSNNAWPPEIDYPDWYGSGFANYFPATGSEYSTGMSFSQSSYYQYSIDVSGSTITWYETPQGGSTTQAATTSLYSGDSGKSFYPIVDVTKDNAGTSPTDGSSMPVKFIRVYSKVASGACYSSIPTAASGTTPHTGSC